jgi:two-component system response regulator RegA
LTSTIFTVDSAVSLPATALVVEPSLPEALSVVSALLRLGLRATVTDNFHEAKARLLTRPALLVTELRLGEYNGLHLVLRGKSARADMAAVIVSGISDPVLSAEAERLGATFVLKGLSAEEFRAAICRTLFRALDSVDGPIRAPFERRKARRRKAVRTDHLPERRASERRRELTPASDQTATS